MKIVFDFIHRNRWKLLLYFCFIFFISPYPLLAGDPIEKKIFISTISAQKGINPKLGERIQFIVSTKVHSELSSQILNLDPNFIRSYRATLPKDTPPCQSSTCEDLAISTFEPSHRLMGEVEVAGIKLKMTLRLENLKSGLIEKTSSFYIPLNDFEDEIEFQIREFFGKQKKDRSDALSKEPELHISPLKFKEIVPILIIPDLETEPSSEEIKYLKSRETSIQKGDLLAGKNDYKNAYLQYNKILSAGVPEKIKLKYPKYFEYESNNLLLRIHSSYFNMVALDIQKLDLVLQNKNQMDSAFLEGTQGKYQKIYDSIKDESNPNNEELRSILKLRKEELEVLLFFNLEKKADELMRELKFQDALKEYMQIHSKLAQHKTLATSKELRSRIDQKIKSIISYKKAYTLNGARTYCGLAEKIFSDLSKNTSPPLTLEQRKKDERFLNVVHLAEDLFSKSDYIQEEAIDICKSAFTLAERDVTNLAETKEKVIPREEKSFFADIDGRKFVFPGYWHFKEERGSLKSNLFFYGGITSFLTTAALGGVMAQNAHEFNTMKRLPFTYSLQSYTFFTYSLYTDIQTEESLLQSYNSSKSNFSISAAVFGSLYVLSILDSTLIPRQKSAAYQPFFPSLEKEPGGSFQIQIKPNLHPLSNYRNLENQLQMTYVYNF